MSNSVLKHLGRDHLVGLIYSTLSRGVMPGMDAPSQEQKEMLAVFEAVQVELDFRDGEPKTEQKVKNILHPRAVANG